MLLSLAQEHLALPALPGALSQNHPHTEHQTVTGQSETEPPDAATYLNSVISGERALAMSTATTRP